MSPRLLLFIAVYFLSWKTLETVHVQLGIPQNAADFRNTLRNFGRPPGPLGYFNSLYMAFTRDEAKHFPNLASVHSKMRQIKSGQLSSVYSIWNDTQVKRTSFDHSGFQNAPGIKGNKIRGKKYKRDPSYPITTITGDCETTIGGVNRLCKVCPALTDLGPDKIPRYINELLCEGYELCGVEEVFGICQNTALQQDFLTIQSSGLQLYSQSIRVCCECSLFL